MNFNGNRLQSICRQAHAERRIDVFARGAGIRDDGRANRLVVFAGKAKQ